jgi:von Willebrand factor type A domain
MRIARLYLPALAALALALGACGSSGSGSAGNGNPGGAGGSGGTNGGTGGSGSGSGTGGSGSGRTCTSSTHCLGDDVCNPDTGLCTSAPIACTTHDECGRAAYCDAGTCATNSTGGPCESDLSCRPGESCTGGFCGCEGEQFAAEAVPPNVLIMLDKSGSMDDAVGGRSKWDIALDAIESLLAEYGDKVRFGLMLYPTGDQCGAGTVEIDVNDGTAAQILGALDASGPNGSTPIGASLDAALEYAPLEDTTRANYVLLLTDGEEMCDGDGESAAAALRAKTPEVKTFVVGFGGGVDEGVLNAMAVAGGTELAGSTKYYQADDAASLAGAFADIGGTVLSCSYELSGQPDSASDVYVYIDGEPVPLDATHAEGWDYDPATNQVTFYGPVCEDLRSGAATDLVIVHGCPIEIG